MHTLSVARAFALSTAVLALGCRASGGAGGAPAPTSAAAPAAPAALPDGVTDEMVTQGRTLFTEGSCTRCHGPGGTGGANGPNLTRGSWVQIDGSYDQIVRVVRDGVPAPRIRDMTRRFPMNPRGGPMNLTDAGVRAVAAYVYTISRGKR